MQIARSKTKDRFPLSQKKIIKKTISIIIGYLSVLAFIFAISSLLILYYFHNSTVDSEFMFSFWMVAEGIIILPSLTLLLLSIVPIYIYQHFYYAGYYYDLTNDCIIIRKGLIASREITMPYEHLRNIYIGQDILDRIFGLYNIHVSSAIASSGIEAHIDGLEKLSADGLMAILLQATQQRTNTSKT